MTGPGVEYGGDANATKSGYGCTPWTDAVGRDGAADAAFPDGSRAAAGRRCRNPTGDPGGPWCYALVDGAVVPDYCETNGCDDGDGCAWTVVNGVGGDLAHGHYTTMWGGAAASSADDNGGDATFDLKAWDPAARAGGPLRLSLTAHPAAGSAGFEVLVPADVLARSYRAAIRVQLSWRNGLVMLSAAGRELFSAEQDVSSVPVSYASFVGFDHAGPVAVRSTHCDDRTTAGRYTAATCLLINY